MRICHAAPGREPFSRPGWVPVATLVLAACTLFALASTGERALSLARAGDAIPWSGIAAARLTDWYSCGLFVPLFYWLGWRFPPGTTGWRTLALLYLAAAIGAAPLKLLIYGAVGNAFRPGLFDLGELIADGTISYAVSFLAIAAAVNLHLLWRRGLATAPEPEAERGPQDSLHRFAVRRGNAHAMVRAVDVICIDAQGNYARLHAGAERHLVRQTMASLETRLDPDQFVRVHRSVIVNVAHLRHVHPLSHGEYRLTLSNGESVRSGRSYNDRIRRLLR